jgi:hypothetical protein
MALRDHASVDKNGIAYGQSGCNTTEASLTSTVGMGWFPGYAINIETGERLNMAFAEDSYNYTDNGNDMIWNPTGTINSSTYDNAWGGRHFVYIFGHNRDARYDSSFTSPYDKISSVQGKPIGAGRYDAGKQMIDQIKATTALTSTVNSPTNVPYKWPYVNVMRDAMWVTIPLMDNGFQMKNPANMPCEVKVRLRVKKPYRYGYSGQWADRMNKQSNSVANYVANNANFMTTVPYTNLPSDTAGIIACTSCPNNTVNIMQNNNMPMYEFNTSDIYTMIADAQTAKNAMDYIRIVPNPYYGQSKYEKSRLENKVRITNLPGTCTIKIFTMNGTLVRTLKRDVAGQEDEFFTNDGFTQSKRSPYMDWDLKNQYGVPVASGLYIFHIDAPGVGEKILKWFGVMRPLDLQNY